MRSKITELGVFAVGLSIIGAALSYYRFHFSSISQLEFTTGLVECSFLLALGLAVSLLRTPASIQILVAYFLIATCIKITLLLPQLTQSFVTVGVAAVILIAVAALIYSVGMQAVAESEAPNKNPDQSVQSKMELGPPICPHCESLLSFAERKNVACPRCHNKFSSSPA